METMVQVLLVLREIVVGVWIVLLLAKHP